ncbi:MAG TPA: type VI secretion system tube protein Hcp [Luteolibacter sp.]|nr:type VI secretion system tube protein Hcp [Luteolibacter sp.]
MFRYPAVLALSALLGADTARAQLSAWLDFGGAIKGGALDSRHKDWIDIHGFDIDTKRDFAAAVGGGERDGSLPVFSELGLAKFVDRATPGLFRAIVESGESFPKVTLDLTAGGDQPFARLELENVLVSGQSFAAATGSHERPVELLSLNFSRITYIYILPDGDELFAGYDLETNQSESGNLPGGTNPDSDEDGMPDWWEREFGLSVGVDDSGLDADGDGLTNRQEFELGTHPKSGTSFFKATLAPHSETPGSYQITWNSVPGKAYVIEWSPDLVTPFTTVRSVVAAATSTTETVTPAGTVGLYRVRPQ